MSGASDAELVVASVGDPPRFGEIFDRHAATVQRFLVRRIGADAAEGLLGEVFRIAFERRERYDAAHASARPWLYGIASNLLLKHRRAEARQLRACARLAAAAYPAGSGDPALEGLVDARMLFPNLAEALEALPEGERDALLLFAWEELRYDEIAAALEVPIGTVRSRIHRARRALRELIAPHGEDPSSARARGRRR
jgi:RNA polymerase sigma-70 factor (ECF subfamily)